MTQQVLQSANPQTQYSSFPHNLTQTNQLNMMFYKPCINHLQLLHHDIWSPNEKIAYKPICDLAAISSCFPTNTSFPPNCHTTTSPKSNQLNRMFYKPCINHLQLLHHDIWSPMEKIAYKPICDLAATSSC